MKFTIVTPVLNGMPWLPQCVESVATQGGDGVQVEHIVWDGGSTDGSREWLRAHAGHARLVFEPDSGLTDALRRAFELGTGDALGWLNSDDLLEEHALRTAARCFSQHPEATALTGACLIIRPDGSVGGAFPTLPVVTHNILLNSTIKLAQPATFFRRSAYLQVGGLDPRWRLAMDLDLFLRLLQVGPCVSLPTSVLARFRVHAAALSQVYLQRAVREELAIKRAQGMRLITDTHRILLQRAYLPTGAAETADALALWLRPPKQRP